MLKRFFILAFLPASLNAQSPVSLVDPLIGTAPATTESARKHGDGSEVKGQTFPGVGRPFGMTQWTPETRSTEVKCIAPYYYNDTLITGFRGSHWMSGSCTQDYGSVTLMPFSTTQPERVINNPVSAYRHSKEKSTPAYYSIHLENGIFAEITASVRSGMMRFGFPAGENACLIVRTNSDEKQGKIWFDPKTGEITGYNPVHRIYQGSGRSAGFSGYFVLRFDSPFKVIPNTRNPGQVLLDFGKKKSVRVKIGTSFTGIGAAARNLQVEIPGWDFDLLRKTTEEVWNSTLGKVQVTSDSRDDKVKFYTALYHCYQLPRIASDVDGSYQGFAQDTLIHKTEGFDYYDDFSMWDTYRALHPLMTILEPERSLAMVKSLILKAEQGGWMPIFPAWGSYTAAMIGDHVSTMIADAYLRGIRNFDTETAYRYMHQNAFDSPSETEYKDGKGRRALTSYLKYGYIPLEDKVTEAFHKQEQVSRTLEYALDDYALSQFATALGKTSDAEELLKRARNYRNVFDTTSGYVRGRFISGDWIEPFNPFVKSYFICEGTPFQYTWYVPHDIPGLTQLMGGREAYLNQLEKFFDGGYYWHGNETDQQAPYMFAMAGNLEKTQEQVRRIVAEEYGTGPGGLSGNEDAGQMSAWLVCSMMGFYPACPGKPEYVAGIPSFDEIRIQSSSFSKPLVIKKEKSTSASVVLNGVKIRNNIVRHVDMISGGEMMVRGK